MAIDEMLGSEDAKFLTFFGVSRTVFYNDMLAAVAKAYRESKRKTIENPKKRQQAENRMALMNAIQRVVRARSITREQSSRLFSALCKLAGRAGGDAAYVQWLQPNLF